MGAEVGLAQRRPLLEHDEGLQALAELVVLDPDHRHLGDPVEVGEQVLDLAREDVLAAGDDHLVVAAVDEEAAVLVEVADVAAGEQAVDRLFVAAAGVALHLHLVADEDPADLARRHLLARPRRRGAPWCPAAAGRRCPARRAGRPAWRPSRRRPRSSRRGCRSLSPKRSIHSIASSPGSAEPESEAIRSEGSV